MTKSQLKRLSEIYLEKAAGNQTSVEELKVLADTILALDKNQKDKEVDIDWNARIEQATLHLAQLITSILMRTGVPNFTVIDGGEGND